MKIFINDVGALAVLERGIAASTSLGPAMETIAAELLEISHGAFANESDPTSGAGWVPLKASTLAQRAKTGHDGPILQKSGNLLLRVQTDSNENAAEIGAGVEYGLIHQIGSAPNQGIPARPFVGASPEDLNSFEDILSDHITRRI